jgi:hypothetical protein
MAHPEELFPGVAIALRGIEAREVESFTLHPAVALTFFSSNARTLTFSSCLQAAVAFLSGRPTAYDPIRHLGSG